MGNNKSAGKHDSCQEADKMFKVLSNILDNMDAYVYVSDMETHEILFVNKMMRDVFEIDYDTRGHICWEVLQQNETKRCSFCPINKLEKDPTPIIWDAFNPRTERTYRCLDSVIEWTNGENVHMQFAVDVTDARKIQKDDDNKKNVLINILNNLNDNIYVSDMETDEVLFANKKMLKTFGLTREDAIGKKCWKIFDSGLTGRCPECPIEELSKDLGTPISWDEHNPITNRNYVNTDSVIEWIDGKKVHMQHSSDVTDIIKAKQDVEYANRRLEMALNASGAGVWEMNFDEDIYTYDERSAKLFGFDDKAGTMPIDDILDYLEETIPNIDTELLNKLRSKELSMNWPTMDVKLVLKDGETRYVRIFGNSSNVKDGKIINIIAMNIDITESVNMENELKSARQAAEDKKRAATEHSLEMEDQAKLAIAASEAKSQFLSNMSHEIRTPMNAVIGMATLMSEESLTDKQGKYVNNILVSASSLMEIINDILDFSKIEAKKLELSAINFDFHKFLKNIEEIFTFSTQNKGIGFETKVSTNLPKYLYGDDSRLRQVLVNILGNAVKFTDEGKVKLTVQKKNGSLFFRVEDTGIGMKKEDIPKIFDEFDQVDPNNSRNMHGTGLGLTISKNLIQLMGGSISVKSEPGQGSTFSFDIPFKTGNADEVEKANSMDEFKISAPEAKVLIVDDNEINLSIVSAMLQLYDIDSDMATNGVEALEMIANKKYDIVFMDQMMPKMDGVEATQQLRKIYDKDDLTIVALTANAIFGAKEMLMDIGMNDYISKPIEREPLVTILNKWLPEDKVRS